MVSDKGWGRCAKGHDIDVAGLNFKAGDSYLASAKGRSNQPSVFIDSGGRAYTTETHTLPSARSQGEPLSGRFNLGAGERIEHVVMANEGEQYLMASDAGYGFVTGYTDLLSKNKNGKAVLTLPMNAKVLTPIKLNAKSEQFVVCISNEGRMLIFPIGDLPTLAKGKGNKIISISTERARNREEFVRHLTVVTAQDGIVLNAGKRKMTLKPADWQHYKGERGRRGNKLPRGLQRVDEIFVESNLPLDDGDTEQTDSLTGE